MIVSFAPIAVNDPRLERLLRLAAHATGCPATAYVEGGEVRAAAGLSIPHLDVAALWPREGERFRVLDDVGPALRRAGIRFAASATVQRPGQRGLLVVLDRAERSAFDAGLDALADLADWAAEDLTAPTAEIEKLGVAAEGLRREASARARLAHRLADDLRTPVTSIGLEVHLLEAERLGPLTAQQAKALTTVRRNVERLARQADRLVEPLLAPAARTDLRVVVANVIAGRRDDALRAGIRLVRPVDPPETIVHADPSLEQALDALVERALTDSAAGARVRIELRRSETEAELIVHDGAGLEPAAAGAAMDTPRPDGDFMRAWVRMVAAGHGGRAWAASDGPGKGTRWHVALPLA